MSINMSRTGLYFDIYSIFFKQGSPFGLTTVLPREPACLHKKYNHNWVYHTWTFLGNLCISVKVLVGEHAKR